MPTIDKPIDAVDKAISRKVYSRDHKFKKGGLDDEYEFNASL